MTLQSDYKIINNKIQIEQDAIHESRKELKKEEEILGILIPSIRKHVYTHTHKHHKRKD